MRGLALTWLVSILALGLISCGPRAKDDTKATAPERVERTARTGSGQSERFRTEGARERIWTVRWKTAEIEYTDPKEYGGWMEGVEGTLYQHGKPVSTFRADRGRANKATETLQLEGNVQVRGTRLGATLRAARLEWDAKREIVRALQGVTIEGEWGTTGPYEELWATPNLDRIATPSQFDKP